MNVFRALADAGHGVLLITHDLSVVADIADRVVVMRQGKAVESGKVRQVLHAPQHPYHPPSAGGHSLCRYAWDVVNRKRSAGSNGKVRENISTDSTTPVLAADNVSLAYVLPDGRRLQAVNQVTLEVAQGETLGIVGESGSGKTTLGKLALALQAPQQGEILLAGQPWSGLTERQRQPLRSRIQTIVQDPLGSFNPQYNVAQLLQQPLRLHTTLTAADRLSRAQALLALVGLSPDLLTRRPATLSGGQRQRIAIAQALACEPDILICDEPVSALDVTTQAQVLDLLVALQRRFASVNAVYLS